MGNRIVWTSWIEQVRCLSLQTELNQIYSCVTADIYLLFISSILEAIAALSNAIQDIKSTMTDPEKNLGRLNKEDKVLVNLCKWL